MILQWLILVVLVAILAALLVIYGRLLKITDLLENYILSGIKQEWRSCPPSVPRPTLYDQEEE